MPDIQRIADEADVIVDGYAYKKCDIGFRVLNLNHPEKASVFSFEDEVLETTMDDIEVTLARKYLMSSKKYMEDSYAQIL